MTGRSELNHAEAVATGAIQAQESLESFPRELKVASLYLALTAQRSSFNLVVNDVYLFMKDRYFVGEVLRACLEGKSWSNCTILQVCEPSEQEVEEYYKIAVINSLEEDKLVPPACLYKYRVQKFCSYNDINRVFEAGASHVRRKKRQVTKGKLRLFLKECLMLDSRGIWVIQESVLQNFGVHNLKFGDIFVGSPPKFPVKYEKVAKKIKKSSKNCVEHPVRSGIKKDSAKKIKLNPKTPRRDKNSSQSSNDDMNELKNVFCRSTDSVSSMVSCKVMVRKLSPSEGNRKIIKKVKKKYVKPEGEKENLNGVRKKNATWRGMTWEERQKLKEKKVEIALLDKLKRKEEKMKEKLQMAEKRKEEAMIMRDHNRLREDLECEDLKPLPIPKLVKCSCIPNELFGDFMQIVEFFHNFKSIVKTRPYFSSRAINCEFLETALTENCVDGSLSSVVIMLLTEIFKMQGEDEIQDGDNAAPDIDNDEIGDLSTSDVIRLAAAEYGTRLYHGAFLSEMTLNNLTVTEVLRLHFISCSGVRGESNSRDSSVDPGDPVTILRSQHQRLLHDLCDLHICELPLEEKIGILSCLVDQLLSCPPVREELEKRSDEFRQIKIEVRALKAAEAKRAKELEAQRIKEKKEARLKLKQQENSGDINISVTEDIKIDGECFEKELRSKKKREVQELYSRFRSIAMQLHLCPVGFDRAHRRYWTFSSLPGLFVEEKPFEVGPCLLQPTPKGTLSPRSDGKWQARKKSPQKSPNKKDPVPLPPERKAPFGANKFEHIRTESWVCTSAADCRVHCQTEHRSKWSYFHCEEEITMLLENLNKRGLRENELRKILARDEQWVKECVSSCPLNFVDISTIEEGNQDTSVKNDNSTASEDSSISAVLELILRDRILDLENKISSRCVGCLDVSDFNAWRDAIENGDYDMQCDKLSWGLCTDPKEKSDCKTSGSEARNECDANNILSKVEVVKGEFVITRESLQATQATINSPKKLELTNNRVLEEKNGQNTRSSPRKSQDTSAMEVDNSHKALDHVNKIRSIRNLSCAILQLEQSIEVKYFRKPLVENDHSENDKIYQLKRWETSLMTASSFSQLFLHLSILDSSIYWSRSVVNTRCVACRKSGNAEKMLLCDGCNKGCHMFCLRPKLTIVPEGDWYCCNCLPMIKKKEELAKKRTLLKNDTTNKGYEKRPSKSRKIVHNDICESCGLRYNLILCSSCPLAFHPVCVVPPLTELPEGLWTCKECESQGNDEAEEKENEVTSSRRRSCRKSGPSDLSLNNSLLQDLLSDLMCHKDSWPFLQPVRKAEAPRYHIVVKKPMDFGTMKYKLNRAHYKHNSEFIDDALLVFANCRMYNENDAEVYKCGARLSEYFKKRCKDLGLHCRD